MGPNTYNSPILALLYFILYSFLPNFVICVEHHLYWNTSNPIWKGEAILRVRMGDRIKIYCPDPRLDHRASHLKVFQVSEFSYGECMLETGKQQVVLCNGDSSLSTIITVRPYSSTPNALTFGIGQYYWITTSNGKQEGIDRTMYGLCKTHQMRLKLEVSERLPDRQTTAAPSPIEIYKSTRPLRVQTNKDLPDKISVNQEQLKAVIELASLGKTGTYKHNVIIDQDVENSEPWNPLELNYFKNYYKQDAPLYEPVDDPKDYEIGEDLSMGRSYPSYLSSSYSSWLYALLLICAVNLL